MRSSVWLEISLLGSLVVVVVGAVRCYADHCRHDQCVCYAADHKYPAGLHIFCSLLGYSGFSQVLGEPEKQQCAFNCTIRKRQGGQDRGDICLVYGLACQDVGYSLRQVDGERHGIDQTGCRVQVSGAPYEICDLISSVIKQV